MSTTVSPLLRGEGLPEFRAISPELVTHDIPVLLEQLDQSFSELEQALESALAGPSKFSWDAVMQPLQVIGERLRWSWGGSGAPAGSSVLAVHSRAPLLLS